MDKIVETTKAIKRKPGRPHGTFTKNIPPEVLAEREAAEAERAKFIFAVGDSVLINPENDPWHGFRVTIKEMFEGNDMVSCFYAGKTRAISLSALSHFRDGFKKDFDYNE